VSQVSVKNDNHSVQIRIPMNLKRHNGRKVVILPDGGIYQNSGQRLPCNCSLAGTIARAYNWEGLIVSGQYSSVSDLAAALHLDRSFVARILRLTLLAPDIVEAILRGDEPSGLTYKNLSSRKFPELWCEQRDVFGF
jgi:hypothetical protein